MAFLFLAFHAWSFRAQRKELEKPFTSDYALPTAMFLPYVRILPIHLSAFGLSQSPIMTFLLIKALADCFSHIIERALRMKMRDNG